MMQASSSALPAVAKTGVAYAGFWRRFLAFLIDGTLIAGVNLALYSTVHLLAPDNLDALANIAPVAIAISWASFAVLESSPASGTLGKVALGMYVADLHGDPISFGRAVFRNGLKSVSWLLCGICWVLAAAHTPQQAVHDPLAGALEALKMDPFLLGPRGPTPAPRQRGRQHEGGA